MSAPKVVAIVPVEDASRSIVRPDGRYSLQQVLYDIYAPSFPARVAQLAVVIVFVGGVGHFEGRMIVEGPDTTAIAESVFAFDAQTYYLHICSIAGVVLPAAGTYRFVVELEGQAIADAPLSVVQLQNNPGVGVV